MAKEQDPEAQDYSLIYEDRSTRHAFVRKVLMLVGLQLILTIAIVVPFIYVEPVKNFSLDPKNQWLLWVSVGVVVALSIAIGCFSSVRRKFPINLILLFIYTFALGIMLGFICGQKYPYHVLLAFGITIVLCAALILFAMQVKWDFTGIAPFLIIGVLVLAIMGIVSIFWRNHIFLIVLSSLGVLIYSIYLIVDIQMMLGGKHKYQFSIEDYIMAALCIYTDIITIFIYILSLIGLTMND